MIEEKKLYIKEAKMPIEIFPYMQLIKKILLMKNNYLKKIMKKIIKILVRINYEYKCFNCTIQIKKIENDVLCILPIKTYKKKSILRFIKNIKKLVKQEKIDNIILSEKLKTVEKIKKSFLNKELVEGKYLLRIMIDEVINYISDIKNERIENQTIYILANEYSKSNLEIIKLLANKVKSVNIITNKLNRFLIFEKNLYEKNGLMVAVSSNKRKGLSRANWIINLDFTNDIIKQYKMNRTAIFINLVDEQFEISKSFSGVIVNGLKIKKDFNKNLPILRFYNIFNYTVLYESTISKNKSLAQIRENLKEDNVRIKVLIGNRGDLKETEYIKIA